MAYYQNNYEELNKLYDERPKNVLWIVSHCKTFSEREVYVEEMQKYIDIDIYGECGPLDCPKMNSCEKGFKVGLTAVV